MKRNFHKMRFLRAILLLVFVFITKSFAQSPPCPPIKCAENPPKVVDKKITLTVLYDNDAKNQSDRRNADYVLAVCNAMDVFKEALIVDFKVGVSSLVDNKGIMCGNCDQDSKDACASSFVQNFPAFLCCYKRGRNFYDCAKDQNVEKAKIDNCDKKTNEWLPVIQANRSYFLESGIPSCYLPDSLYNGRHDSCKRFKTFEELTKILCTIFNEAGLSPQPCQPVA